MLKEIKNFIIHLRLHYQILILSGGYLLAGLYVENPDQSTFWLQFLNVHVLLFGGATAFNSWWDKDEGPIGGLKSPPPMSSWMRSLSLAIQGAGWLWAWTAGFNFMLIYSLSILMFWLYSSPITRWKGKPHLSLIAIGVSTGTNSFFMGILAAGTRITWVEDLAAIGVALIMLSLYPASQVYQTEEDRVRGDQTFALRYGLKGVKVLYYLFFLAGAALISFTLFKQDPDLGYSFGGLTLAAYLLIGYLLGSLRGSPKEYSLVMKIKFLASFCFVVFILSVLLVQSII